MEEELKREQILKFIPRDTVENCENNQNISETLPNDNFYDKSDSSRRDSSESITSEIMESNMLKDMIYELKKIEQKSIWQHISPRMLFKYYLSDAEAISSSFIVAELDALNEIVKKYCGQKLFNKSENKSSKVNKLSSIFEDKSMWASARHTHKKVQGLKDLSFKIVSSGVILKAVLVTSVVRIKCALSIKEWENGTTLPMSIHIDHCNEDFKLFCFPEYSQTREQIESCTLDPTHMLTNLCAHSSRNGFDFFDKEAFLHVSDKNKDLLPRPMITEILDKQNAEIAKRFFL